MIDDAPIDESDYGSDIDEASLDAILLHAESQSGERLILTSIDQDPVLEHVAHLSANSKEWPGDSAASRANPLPDILRQTDPGCIIADGDVRLNPASQADDETATDDTRSPLERFRTKPKKPLSVTDIISPAWCEQQYLYSLSKYGRIRRTPAMRQGSSVHKILEEQVHTSVPVQVKTREDTFGLRIWNVIQGIRTLRTAGLTREFEIWGVVEGQVINGIIDEVTVRCPDEVLAARLAGKAVDETSKSGHAAAEEGQRTLEDFFKQTDHHVTVLEQGWNQINVDETTPIYLVDHKTRQSSTLPSDDARLRPTQMQLMLYHRLFCELASGSVDAAKLFDRYSLDASATFSDLFIAEISNLDAASLDEAGFTSSEDETPDPMTELLEHNNLNSLWQHMIAEFQRTIPDVSKVVSPVLAAEFRTAFGGKLIGRRSFAMDTGILNAYVQDEMNWWHGKRQTKGVEIEDAFKCRICDFAEECTWRKEKLEETTRATKSKKAVSTRKG